MPTNWDWSARTSEAQTRARMSGPFGGLPIGGVDRAISANASSYYSPAPGDKRGTLGTVQQSPAETTNKFLLGMNYQGAKSAFPRMSRYTASAYYNGEVYLVCGIDLQGPYEYWIWKFNPSTRTFKPLAEMPQYMAYSCCAIIGSEIYVFGGMNDGGSTRRFWKYNCDTNVVTVLSTSAGPTARANSAMAAIGTKLYVFGGYDGNYCNDMWEYDTGTSTWTQKTSGATARSVHTMVAYNNKLYVHAGSASGSPAHDLWEYTPGTDSWLQKTGAGATYVKYYHNSFVYSNYMYVFPGTVTSSWLITRYNFTTDSWATLVSHSGVNCQRGLAWSDGSYMYEIGGVDNGAGNVYNYWYNFNFSTEVYTNTRLHTNMNSAYGVVSNANTPGVWDGKLVIYPDWEWNQQYTKNIYIVNPLTREVTLANAQLPASRAYATSCWYNGKFYVYGGYVSGWLNTLYAWDAATDTMATKTSSAVSDHRYPMIVSGDNGYLYAFSTSGGGSTGDATYVWRYDIAGDSWTKMTAQFTDAGYLPAPLLVGSRVYFVGGFGSLYKFRYYDINADSFTTLADRSFASCDSSGGLFMNGNLLCTCVVNNGSAYVSTMWSTNLTTLVDCQLASRNNTGPVQCARIGGGLAMLMFGGYSTNYYVMADIVR